MLDFNTKKELLKNLRAKRSKNKLLWLPCIIAELAVKLWFSAACSIDMALSDKDGNFLGIKKSKKKKSRKKDDIVYVRKSLFGRIVSLVLTFSFVFMMLPVIDFSAYALDFKGETYTYYETNNGNQYYYKQADYDNAILLTTDIAEYKIAYGAVWVEWEVTSGADGYTLNCYEEGTRNPVAAKDIPDGLTTEAVFDGLASNPTITYKVEIIPYQNIDLYQYIPAILPDPDDTTSVGVSEDMGVSRRIYKVDGKVGSSSTKNVGSLNATMMNPVIVSSEYDNDITVTLEWEPSTQNTGSSSDIGKPADGYIVFQRTVDAATSKVTEYKQIEHIEKVQNNTLPNGNIYCEATAQQGMIYEYYILAYRTIFGAQGYREDNPGMIVSGDSTSVKPTRVATTPTTPKNLKISSNKKDTLTLTWSAGSGNCSGYVIYRSETMLTEETMKAEGTSSKYYDPVTKTWDYKRYIRENAIEVDQVSSATKKYADSSPDLVNGRTYYYYVMAYLLTDSSGSMLTGLPATVSGSLDAKIERPQGLIATPSDGIIDLKWDAVKDADGYKISITKKTNNDGSTTGCGGVTYTYVTKNSYSHVGLLNGETYAYQIQAYINAKSSDDSSAEDYDKVLSEYSDTRTAVVGENFGIPQDVTVTTEDGENTVKWSAVKGAEGYELFYQLEDGDWRMIDISRTNFTHTRLNNGDVYSYYVRAYKRVNGVKVYSDPSVTVSITVGETLDAPKDIKGESEDGMVELSWSKVNGAEGYILHASSGGQSFKYDVSKLKYEHTGLENGSIWTYYVEAYKTVNGTRIYSEPSARISITVGEGLEAPRDFIAEPADGMIELSWSKVNGAEGYVLSASCNGSSYQYDVSKTKYEHTGLRNGELWTYSLRAYKTVNGVRIYSDSTSAISVTVGDSSGISAPRDFTAETSDGKTELSWTKADGADGYILYAYNNGSTYQIDLSKTKYEHSGLENGDVWTYYLKAYKFVNGIKVFSEPTRSITVTIGVSLNAVVDLFATAGNRQIDLSWSKVNGAEGYILYLYDDDTMEFEPLTVTSKTAYSHVGLKNGREYTYMVAAFKTVNGERIYSDYSMSVSAIPTNGSVTDIDRTLNVKGTTPYGISHSEYISAKANHDAFDESVDVYFTTNQESTEAVKNVLKHYANGLKSFIIYPFDISIYKENTLIEVEPNDGYSVTVTMPIPDKLIAYRDYITVVHINENLVEDVTESEWSELSDQQLEVLPCAILDIDNVWCVQFVCSSFSPYALIIYKDHLNDVSAGGGVIDGSFAGDFNSGILLFSAVPDVMISNKKLKVIAEKKRYRIKRTEKNKFR